ncbi:MAG: nucleotidyltransferase family protein [Thaumarchaeota archaeon]|nr:nucleotidyltransferase family protein [Nitrososphaerota archaeon]
MSERGREEDRVKDAKQPPGGDLVSAILLAAGLSSRFGKAKQLAELEGTALVSRAVATLERAPVGEIVVVVGHRAAEVTRKLEGTAARIVVNEDYGTGLGSSIRTGVGALSRESRAAVVCLADQPFVTADLIGQIVSRHRQTGADVVASFSEGLVTPPVLFSSRLYGEMAELRGDRGAKFIIEKHPGFEKVSVEPGLLLDVDTEEDLRRARSVLGDGVIRKGSRARGADGP